MKISKKVFKRNNSLTTQSNYTQGRTSVDRSDVAIELFNRGLIDYDVNELGGKKRQKKLYSLSKTAKFAELKKELELGLKTTIIDNELVGTMLFVVDGRTPDTLIEQCINSALNGIHQLNPRTNKIVVKQMGWISKAS